MPLYPYQGKTPAVAPNCYIAPTATLIGDVTIESGVSIWFGCVLRGDVSPIVIGARTNIQDNTVIHGEDGCPTTIGEGVTVGHGAIIHAATIDDNVLVGMGAVLLSRSKVETGTIIGARALVPQDVIIPKGSLAVGLPARVVRSLTQQEVEHIQRSANHYVENAARYLSEQTPG